MPPPRRLEPQSRHPLLTGSLRDIIPLSFVFVCVCVLVFCCVVVVKEMCIINNSCGTIRVMNHDRVVGRARLQEQQAKRCFETEAIKRGRE